MWQSRVEIKHNSIIADFDCTTMFEALKCRTFVKGGAHARYIDLSGIHAFTHAACMSLAINRSSVPQRFKCTNVVEIHNEIMLD